jgi:hypothetical protein
MAEAAALFTDKEIPSAVRVEWVDDDGGCEVAILMARGRLIAPCNLRPRSTERTSTG